MALFKYLHTAQSILDMSQACKLKPPAEASEKAAKACARPIGKPGSLAVVTDLVAVTIGRPSIWS